MNLKLGRIFLYGFSALVFLVPLFWLPFSFEAWEFPKEFLLFFLNLALLIVYFFSNFSPEERPKLKIFWPFDLLVLGFLIVAAVSALFSVDKVSSIFGFYGRFSNGLIGLISFALVYFLASRLPKDKADRVIKTILWSASFIVLIAYLSLTGILAKLVSFSPALLQRNFNLVSPSLEGLVMFLAPLMFLSIGFREKKLAWVFLAFSAGLILLVDYAPSLIVLGLTSLLYLGLISFKKKSEGIKSLALILLLFLTLSAAGMSLDISKIFPKSLVSFPREVTLDLQTSWQISLEAFKSRPILGSGPGTFFYNFSKFKQESFNRDPLWQIRFDRPVSHILEMMSTTGLFSLLIFLVLAVLAIKSPFPSLGHVFRPSPDLPFLNLVFAFISSVFAQAFYYQNVVLGFSFWLFLGLITGLTAKEKGFNLIGFLGKFRIPRTIFDKDGSGKRILLLVFILFLSLALIFVVFWASRIYWGDFLYYQALGKAKIDDKVALNRKAVSVNPYFAEYQIVLSRSLINLAIQESQKADTKNVFQTVVSAVDSARRATEISPNWVASWETLGMIYQEVQGLVSGTEDWGIKSFERAVDLEPANPLLHSRLGRVYFAKGDLNKAKEELVKARALKPDFLEPRIFLGLVREKQGDLKGALSYMSHLGQLYPLNTDIAFQLGRLYFNQNKTNEAILEFERALKLNPSHLDSLYSLALALEKKGDKTQAISFLERALKISPNNQILKDKLEQLEKH
ncbi:MAG: tetratricopeptide repeat protein [bacterium]|nr:tetratricopeptide repeat protein [bacterium]